MKTVGVRELFGDVIRPLTVRVLRGFDGLAAFAAQNANESPDGVLLPAAGPPIISASVGANVPGKRGHRGELHLPCIEQTECFKFLLKRLIEEPSSDSARISKASKTVDAPHLRDAMSGHLLMPLKAYL